MVLAAPDSFTRMAIDVACRRAGFTPRPVLVLDSGEALRERVRAGLGITILPERYVARRDAELKAVRLVGPTPRGRLRSGGLAQS